jgi:hypothetical protein
MFPPIPTIGSPIRNIRVETPVSIKLCIVNINDNVAINHTIVYKSKVSVTVPDIIDIKFFSGPVLIDINIVRKYLVCAKAP